MRSIPRLAATLPILVLVLAACSATTPASDQPSPSHSTSPATPMASPTSSAAAPEPSEAAAGGRIAYLRDLELILLDLATGTETPTGILDVTPIAFTTDGGSLIGYRFIPDNPHAVNLVRQPLDGSEATVLADSVPHLSARPSPDGRLIAFASTEAIVLVSLDGGDARQLNLAGTAGLIWSPDGAYLATELARPNLVGSDLFVVDVATGATRQLTNDEWEDSPYAWTDDGSAVLTSSHRGGDGTRLAFSAWQVDVPSGELTHRPELEPFAIDPAFPSPDGRWDARVSDTGRLMIAEPGRAVGSRIDSVDSSVHLTWSPNGAWLVWTKFSSPEDSDVYMVRVPDGAPIQLTRTPGVESHPVWGPVRHGF